MKRGGNKRAQQKLSFGMLFSIMLIIMFLIFAFYVILKFINFQKYSKTALFVNGLQEDIDKMWKAPQGSKTQKYSLPGEVLLVCFVDFNSAPNNKQELYSEAELVSGGGKNNLFVSPIGASKGFDSAELEHIDIKEIIKEKNPYCIENKNNKVEISISKDYSDKLVSLK